MSQHFCEYDAHTKAVSLEEIEAEIVRTLQSRKLMTENKLLTHTDQKKVLNIEDSDKAAEAIRTLTNLGIIQWRDATEEEDSLGIDVIA